MTDHYHSVFASILDTQPDNTKPPATKIKQFDPTKSNKRLIKKPITKRNSSTCYRDKNGRFSKLKDSHKVSNTKQKFFQLPRHLEQEFIDCCKISGVTGSKFVRDLVLTEMIRVREQFNKQQQSINQ